MDNGFCSVTRKLQRCWQIYKEATVEEKSNHSLQQTAEATGHDSSSACPSTFKKWVSMVYLSS